MPQKPLGERQLDIGSLHKESRSRTRRPVGNAQHRQGLTVQRRLGLSPR